MNLNMGPEASMSGASAPSNPTEAATQESKTVSQNLLETQTAAPAVLPTTTEVPAAEVVKPRELINKLDSDYEAARAKFISMDREIKEARVTRGFVGADKGKADGMESEFIKLQNEILRIRDEMVKIDSMALDPEDRVEFRFIYVGMVDNAKNFIDAIESRNTISKYPNYALPYNALKELVESKPAL